MNQKLSLLQRASLGLGRVAFRDQLEPELKGQLNPAFQTTGYGAGGGNAWGWLNQLLPGSQIDYRREAGDLHLNSIVLPCISWMMRAFPEAPVVVDAIAADGSKSVVANHPLPALLRRPNGHYSGRLLWGAACLSLVVDGNAYWYKVRSEAGKVVGLWWVPHYLLHPAWEGSDYITCYLYTVAGKQLRVDPADIVHFREGVDPNNTRKGFSPLAACLREVCTDNEAGNFSAAILRNMGVPGVIISPKAIKGGGPVPTLNKEQAGAIISLWKEKFTGDRRGEPYIQQFPIDVQSPGLSPEELVLDVLRKVPEERITAALGIPAIVAGMGAGLARCIHGNMRVSTVNRGPVEARDIIVGDQVWAVHDGRLQPASITWSGKTGHKPVFEVKTKNRTVTATDNHPFLTRRSKKVPAPMIGARRSAEWEFSLEWVQLKDLRVNDYIVAVDRLPDTGGATLPDGKPATVELLEWLGAFVGDGCYSAGETDKALTLCIPKTDRVRAYYEALSVRLFEKGTPGGAVRPGKRTHPEWTADMVARHQAGEAYRSIARDYPITNASVRDRIRTVLNPVACKFEPVVAAEAHHGFSISSKSACAWVRSLGFLRGARNKRIPPWVFGLSEELRMAFMRGLIDTDGHIDVRGHVEFAFASEDLCYDIWHLANSIGGSVSNVYYSQVDASRLPNKGNQETYDAWSLKLTCAADNKRIGTHDPVYQDRLALHGKVKRLSGAGLFPSSKAVLPADCGWAKVQSIEPAGTEDVYDLTVDAAHNFIAAGLVVHNSTFSNFKEAREAAYESNIIPSQCQRAEELDVQLLGDLGMGNPAVQRCRFDTSNVRALQDDQNDLHTRVALDFSTGLIRRNEARAVLSFPALDGAEGDAFGTPDPNAPQPVSEDAPPAKSRQQWPARFKTKPKPKHTLTAEDAAAVAAFTESISEATPIVEHSTGTVIGTLKPATAHRIFRATESAKPPSGKVVVEPTGGITYHPPTQQYATVAGRPVSADTVRATADAANKAARFKILDLTGKLQSGNLAPDDWEIGMLDVIKDLHGAETALGYGGFGQMTDKGWSGASEVVKDQWGWFAGFKQDLMDGRYDPTDGSDGYTSAVLSRAGSYANSGRGTFENARVGVAKDSGANEARSVRGAVDSCDECIEQEELGWQAIDEIVPINSRQCLSNCFCTVLTRTTGDSSED